MERDRAVIEVLNELVARRSRWGFWKLYDRLRLDGQCINHKRLHRVYCAMKLNLPRRTKQRLPTRIRQPLAAPAGLNQIWALDFMTDSLCSGGGVHPTRQTGSERLHRALQQDLPGQVLDAYVFETVEQVREITENWLSEYTRSGRMTASAVCRP